MNNQDTDKYTVILDRCGELSFRFGPMCGATRDVRFVPIADIASKSVSAAQNVLRNSINADLSPSVKPGSSVNLLVPK